MPRVLLHAEGAAVAAAAIALYFHAGYPWWLLVVLALAPDLAAVGYLAGPRVGAVAYDTAHTYALPVILATAGVIADAELAVRADEPDRDLAAVRDQHRSDQRRPDHVPPSVTG